MATDRPGTATRPAPPAEPGAGLREASLRELVGDLTRTTSALVRKEAELLRAEVRDDLRRELRMAGGLGAAGLCAILALQLMLTAVVLALMQAGILPGWAAALVVAAVVLAVGTAAGLWGWARRVRTPLRITRRSVQENVRWAKERIA